MSSESGGSLEVTLQKGQEYVPPVTTHLLRSRYVAQTFKINVMRPATKWGEQTHFPTVFATDGNATFDMFRALSLLMQSSGHELRRFILVGIGYPGDSPRAGAYLRGRDFMFAGYPEFSRAAPTEHGVLHAEPGAQTSYGAREFQQFIEHELIPLIETDYPAIPGERTYFGHSAGGGFGLHTLFTRSDLFKNYIISSPGLTYHGESSAGVKYENYDFLLEDAREFIASQKALTGIRLYLSAGAAEEFEPQLAAWRLTSSVHQMASVMRRAAILGLELITEVFPGETHATAWPMAFMHGLKAVLHEREGGAHV